MTVDTHKHIYRGHVETHELFCIECRRSKAENEGVTPDTTDAELRAHIEKRVRIWFGEPVLAVEDEIISLIHSREQEIFRRVETEVIGEDVQWNAKQRRQFSTSDVDSFAHLFAVNTEKKEARERLATIKGNGEISHE